jgi:hypothetical protein
LGNLGALRKKILIEYTLDTIPKQKQILLLGGG